MKIRFSSDDDLPLNELLKFHMMTIIIRFVFSEDGKFYPQSFLDDGLYEFDFMPLWTLKILRYQKIDASEGVDIK